jgi:uncharacterized protein (DUF1778 family)
MEAEVLLMARHSGKKHAQLSVRLPADLKETIKDAAAHLGKSVSDFAVSTLVTTAQTILQQEHVTRLSGRDRDVLIAVLDDADAKPNKALRAAAKKYRDRA